MPFPSISNEFNFSSSPTPTHPDPSQTQGGVVHGGYALTSSSPTSSSPAPALLPQLQAGVPGYTGVYTNHSQFQDLFQQTHTPSIPSVNVAHMELHDLLKNPRVLELYNNSMKSSSVILQLTEHNNQLVQEINQLKAGLVATQSSATRQPAPAERPSCYPESILWLEDDYVQDPNIRTTKANPNRKSMAHAIRHKDGTIASKPVYNAISATGRMIIFQDLIHLSRSGDTSGNAFPTRTSLRQNHPKAWLAACTQYEDEQPLLGLCAAHWKAEHMLGNILNTLNQADKHRKKHGIQSSTREASPASDFLDNPPSPVSSSFDIPETSYSRSVPAKRAHSGSTTIGAVRKEKKSKSTSSTIIRANESLVQLTDLGIKTTPILGHGVLDGWNIDVGFITVKDTVDDLKAAMHDMFPNIMEGNGENLLAIMKAYPDFARGNPSQAMLDFIQRVENADPNDKSLDEDNQGAGWGHYQFTAGSMTCASVITSWTEVGNTDIACRLLAAAIRTAKVARYVCEQRSITATAYISDMYVERVIDSLWVAWTSAPGAPTLVSNTVASNLDLSAIHLNPATSNKNITDTGEKPKTILSPEPRPECGNVGADSSVGSSVQETDLAVGQAPQPGGDAGDSKILQSLHNKELRKWIAQHGVLLVGHPNKQRKNQELVEAIMNDPNCPKPTQSDLETFISQRTVRKRGPKAVAAADIQAELA